MTTRPVGTLSALLLLPFCALTAQLPATLATPCPAQTGGDANRPFPVCDVSATIARGPYLSAPTDTSATITWTTDIPAHVKVRFGLNEKLDQEQVPMKDGMLTVGTLHSVRLTGLLPGRTYRYQLVMTPVVELLSYWPKKGRESESPAYALTTFDPRKTTTSFASVSDLHESLPRIAGVMQKIDWPTTDFLVNTGDSFNGVTSEAQLWDKWLTPVIAGGLGSSKPLIFARGNHDTRGGFARQLGRYVPIEEGRFYYARDAGPVHLIVIDTGEDKADSTQVYSRLNVMESYRREELAWFKRHAQTSARLKSAPFRVVVMHQPDWGWVSGDNARGQAAWTAVANEAKVDLIIAGHIHRYSLTPPGGPAGNNYPILVVGQDQVAKVKATMTELVVTVIDKDGTILSTTRIPKARAKK